MKQERGLTLMDVLVWLAIMSIVSIVAMKLISLHVSAKNETDVAQFYEEVNVIDSYIRKLCEEDVSVSFTESELVLTGETHTFRLSNTQNKLGFVYKNNSNGETQTVYLNHIYSFKITSLDTIAIKGQKGANDYIYKIPVESTLQIYYNHEPRETNWFREVVTYVF